jgi:hypothetical protein
MTRKVVVASLYSAVLLFAFDRCAYNDSNIVVDCDAVTLAVVVVSTQNASSCKSIDGVISVSATGGVEPYDFKINDGEYQTNTVFTGLGPGTHTVRVKDFNNCWQSVDVTIDAEGSDLEASATTTADDQCFSDNGALTVTATGGTAPYQYQINSGGFGTQNSFTGLAPGAHSILVKDAEECQTSVNVQVPRGSTGTSFATTIEPIMETHCNLSGCHGAGTGSRDWTVFANVKSNANDIKTRTGNRSMPPVSPSPLTQQQIDQIACWVDDGAPNN